MTADSKCHVCQSTWPDKYNINRILLLNKGFASVLFYFLLKWVFVNALNVALQTSFVLNIELTFVSIVWSQTTQL